MRFDVATLTQAIDHLHTAHRADAARRAFTAGFFRTKLHGKTGLLRHIGTVVEHHQAPVTQHCTRVCQCLVRHRYIELIRRHIGPQRPTYLYRFHWPTRESAATEFLDQFPRADAKRHFNNATSRDISGQLKHLSAS